MTFDFAFFAAITPTVQVGANAIFFVAMNLIKLAPYLAPGQFTRANLSASAALFPIAIAASVAGVWFVRRAPPARFQAIIDRLLLAVGAKLLFDELRGLHLLG